MHRSVITDFAGRSARILLRPTSATVARELAGCPTRWPAALAVIALFGLLNGHVHTALQSLISALVYTAIATWMGGRSGMTGSATPLLRALALIAPAYTIDAWMSHHPMVGFATALYCAWVMYTATKTALGLTRSAFKTFIVATLIASLVASIV